MRDDKLDRAITQTLRERLGLTQEREDALWRGFVARSAREAEAWAFFATTMIHFNALLRPALAWASWPVSGLGIHSLGGTR